MDPQVDAPQVRPIQGPITTADSQDQQRLQIDATANRAKKKKALMDRVSQVEKVRKQSMDPQN